jgi:WD40 repeat protein
MDKEEAFLEAQEVDAAHDEMDTDVDTGANDDAQSEGAELMDDSIQGFFKHEEPVYGVRASGRHDNIIASGGGDDKAYIWNADTGEQLFCLEGHTDSVVQVAFSAVDSRYLATGAMDGGIRVWNVETGAQVVALEGPSEEIFWLAWHQKGDVLACGSADGTAWVWSIPSGQLLHCEGSHGCPVTCGAFTADGKFMVTCSEDGCMRVWSPKNGEIKLTVQDPVAFHAAPITSLSIQVGGDAICTASADGIICLTTLSGRTFTRLLVSGGNAINAAPSAGIADDLMQQEVAPVEAISFSPSHGLLAAAALDGTLLVWDVLNSSIRSISQESAGITQLVWHPDLPVILASSLDGWSTLRDGRTAALIRTCYGHQGPILASCFTASGDRYVSSSEDGTCLVFATDVGEGDE